tara:strand:+ start:104 stop:544 length:441 start_codon:yes stop_codon:yes gene_type:complete
MSKDSQSWMKSLTGISRAELLINSKHCKPWELNMKFLKREDVIFTPKKNFREGVVFYIFTNFQKTERLDMLSYEIYDAIWDNDAKLIWTERDNTNRKFKKPQVHSRHNFVLMGDDTFKKIDAEFMQKGMLVNLFLNWEELPWGDLK